MNPFDLNERVREADEAEARHEAEEAARRDLRSDPDAEAPDEQEEEPPED